MRDDAERFDGLMSQVMTGAAHFGHRQHVHLSWLAVRRYGASDACHLVSAGIQRTARYAGAPQKYHSTMSRAWIELIAYHVAEHDIADFDEFDERNPALLDKRLLLRFYEPSTLASPAARTGWVDPDRAAFPRLGGAVDVDQYAATTSAGTSAETFGVPSPVTGSQPVVAG